MQSRAPIRAKQKLVESPEWQEPIRDEAKKHVRFIWATQFGTGKSGEGLTGYKNTPAKRLARSLSDRAGVPQVVKARQEARMIAKRTPIKLYGA